MEPQTMAREPKSGFRNFARITSDALGSPSAFLLALGAIALWAAVGAWLGFTATWLLVINTATTVTTFLMIFLVQHTQNRDAKAFHLKLDELIRGVRGARTELVGLEEMSDADLDRLEAQFKALRQRKRGHPEGSVE